MQLPAPLQARGRLLLKVLLLKHDSRGPLWVAKGWVLRQSLKSGWALRVLGHGGRVSEALGVALVLREGHL